VSKVREFHHAFGLGAPAYPPLAIDPELVRLRGRLIREEYEELLAELHALAHADNPVRVAELLAKVLKEAIDLCYVAEGTAIAFGLPFDRAYDEVHRSNMSKLGADGKPIVRSDGKVLKGPNYFEADMGQFVHIIESEASDEDRNSDR
jgi:predicted HAD superfamily Cof-like phosphohydrolase